MEEGYSRAKMNRPIALRLTISTFSTRSGFDRAGPCHLIGHRFPDARPKVAVFALPGAVDNLPATFDGWKASQGGLAKGTPEPIRGVAQGQERGKATQRAGPQPLGGPSQAPKGVR